MTIDEENVMYPSRKIMTQIVLVFSLITLIYFNAYPQNLLHCPDRNSKPNFFEIKKAYNEYWKAIPENERSGWKQYKRWEYFWEPRVDNDGNFPKTEFLLDPLKSKYRNKYNQPLSTDNEWTLLGPVGNPERQNVSYDGIGRVNVVRFGYPSNKHIWVGTAFGGVWRTLNGGVTWEHFDFKNFLTLGVSDIAIAPKNNNVIYVATGDADGSYGSMPFYTVGIVKTTDGGATWKATNFSYTLDEAMLIGRILVDPKDEDVVIAGTNRGVYKTTDGGETWEEKSSAGFFRDMEFSPGKENTIIASTYSLSGTAKLFRSTDRGETWEVTNEFDNVVRIALGVTPANPYYVYALCAHNQSKAFHSFLKSNDQGKTWSVVADAETHNNYLGWYNGGNNDNTRGQGHYDLAIDVSKIDPDVVYIGGINIWKSKDGGASWQKLTKWSGSDKQYVHADHHDIAIPNAYNIVFAGHDGGIDYSTDEGATWTNINGNMSITQFYKLGISQNESGYLLAGAQDNGTSRLRKGKWMHVNGGDGMECAIHPTDNDIAYSTLYYGKVYISTNGGDKFQKILDTNNTHEDATWVTPFDFDPEDPSVIYVGHENVWKISNGGTKREQISDFNDNTVIRNVKVAPGNNDIIFVDKLRTIYVTYDGGANWDVLANTGAAISYMAVDPEIPERVYLTFSGFDEDSKVMMIEGETSINLSGNLPNVPVNCVVYQEDSPQRLYIGTDIGVYYSEWLSGKWIPYGQGLPNVVVNELEIQYNDNKLIAATYGRGVWETEVSDCNPSLIGLTVRGDSVMCSGDSLLIEAESGFENYIWSDGTEGQAITVYEDGLYSVEAIKPGDSEDCKSRSRGVQVETLYVPDITISTKDYNPICEGESITLSAKLGFESYMWSTGETDRKITVSEAGSYSVTGTASNGCENVSETFEVLVEAAPEKPEISMEDNFLICSESNRYLWYFNDEPLDSATEQKLDYYQYGIGTYKVEVFVGNECSAISDPFYVTAVDDEDLSGASMKIHPNPGDGLFYIDFINFQVHSVDISVSEVSGKKLFNQTFNLESANSRRLIDLKDYPAGVYYLRVVYANRVRIEKLVKH